MSFRDAAEPITTAIASIEGVTSHVEIMCARVGEYLGRSHTTFRDLSVGLRRLSLEMSGRETEGPSAALQSISGRLNGFAEAVPAESALLGKIGAMVGETSSILDALAAHIGIVTIIARSARIESAALDRHQANFLDFTREVFDLARGIQAAVGACAQDQAELANAIDIALQKQRDFETRYSGELRSVSSELIAVYEQIERRQNRSAQLADATLSGTARIADAVGNAIVSLQAGDSVRQRLEHVCDALRLARSSAAALAPSLQDRVGETARAAPAICMLQVEHLKGVASSFGEDIGLIQRSLASLCLDAAGIVEDGRTLVGDDEADTASSLSLMRQKLTRASVLTTACEDARRSVDAALSVVADALVKFRVTVAGLADAILDIMLIGMNAGLKAGQLGERGRAFVVIANELKGTAEKISSHAGLLEPKLDQIAHFADDLKRCRDDGQVVQATDPQPSLTEAMVQIETGNRQLEMLMHRLMNAGEHFEHLLSDAQTLMALLAGKNSKLPATIDLLQSAGGFNEMRPPLDRDSIEPVLDELFVVYSMKEERDIHHAFLSSHGLVQRAVDSSDTGSAESDDVLFF